MNIEEYRDFCLSLGDGIEEKFPFSKFKNGEGVLVFYISGHMFSYFDCDDFKVISLKCQPERIEELKAEHDCIGNPYNESSKHWIGIDPQSAPDELLKGLTRNSYEIVKAKYTKKKKESLILYSKQIKLKWSKLRPQNSSAPRKAGMARNCLTTRMVAPNW